MKWKISHVTKYEYAELVPFCQNIVYLTPRKTAHQRCFRHRLSVRPHPSTYHRRTDYFGNTAAILSIDRQHRLLKINATSTVEVVPNDLPEQAKSVTWESVRDGLPLDRTATGLNNYQFAFRSPHVPLDEPIADYTRTSFASGRPLIEALADLNNRIHTDFKYDPKATSVSTPISAVFEMRRGVCQDLAHLLLSGLRSLGLAARYVSGYLRTRAAEGQERLVGADASHAWVSVYCGEHGWVDIDPTNNVFASTDHITVAWGRDYSDVCPVAGMYIGGGAHALNVAVDVSPAER